MNNPSTIAVIDIGKTNAKVALVDAATLSEIAVRTTPNTVMSTAPYPHFDTGRLWSFVLDSLKALHAEHPVDAISITTHGATGVLMAGRELAMPVIDYEFTGPEVLSEDYARIRPPFAETGTPKLPGGLNVGAQIFYQAQTFPQEFAEVTTILMYAQYWSFLLSGVLANEVTSLGCHTDLWEPDNNRYSSMVRSQGWEPLMAPVRKASDVLATLLPEVAAYTGIPATTPVHCGIHDSNASLLPHVLSMTAPFSVISTGTWVIVMSVGGRDVVLDEQRDTLINVNALGQPVRSARFMGGRAFSVLGGRGGVAIAPADMTAVLERDVMILPSTPEGSGPYPHNGASWTAPADTLSSAERTVAISFYLALMTATCLDLIGADGPVIVEGPFSENAQFKQMLAIATGRSVLSGSGSATGTSVGAAMLAIDHPPASELTPFVAVPDARMQVYAEKWRARAEAAYKA
ncbi:FGGY-family carbohydrate kinase [Pararhizobium sp.]|uniref:FGGY-family carbohydrate kinase n=1 Tax=Pararhizobium sp. TaxID=1977563 RepID=UPI00271B9D6E|nr:FGGY-family carbohydrate kinase [Pararhizobium sp.]MDO9416089.1 FGGY-family carbohydrate kinase [Pararhizobium sp.]